MMERDIRNIMMQLEMLLEEYPEAKFYIYNGIRTMVSDLLNSVDCIDDLREES
ncbi:MAG: hypothetical protein JJ966_14000 [Balneolaceae bacterium]|jgi:hypothetical protein|nr:hypothetical protein [Balneolaceae bacterium]